MNLECKEILYPPSTCLGGTLGTLISNYLDLDIEIMMYFLTHCMQPREDQSVHLKRCEV